jgi:glucan phosphoethanolaminetransferase (alkaline phosphatase superfamily)
MSTRQRLFAAEKLDLRIEREYAYLVSIAGIALVYSVISPLVVAASMLYFLLKYAVDRYMLCYVYGHKKRLLGRRKNGQHLPMYGAIFGMKSDFVAHRKMMQLVTQMIIIAMMLSAAYLALIFGTKLADDRRFIFHFTASIFMVVVCVIAFLVHVGVTNWVLNRNVYMSEVKNAQPPSKDNISLGYEPPYPYIQMANQELEDKPEKEQLEEERVGTS